MRTRDPYKRPLRITAIGDELVFLGEGPVNFAHRGWRVRFCRPWDSVNVDPVWRAYSSAAGDFGRDVRSSIT